MSTAIQSQLFRFDATLNNWVPVDRGTFRCAPTITVSTSGHSSGNVIGGKLTLANAGTVKGDAVTVQDVILASKGGVSAAIDCVIFDQDPTDSTFTDRATFALNAADIAK